jgi:integrative and conjugative element protein (TIGR02256 family)
VIFLGAWGRQLKISDEALAAMLSYRQDQSDKTEAGGVLLGRYLRDARDVVIDEVSVPQSGDRRSRFRYFRDRSRHQSIINQAWEQSGGTCTYLGEWHTHPESSPTPSTIDQLNWRRKLLVDTFDEALFFLIVGTEEIRAWEGDKRCAPRPLLRRAKDVDDDHQN